MKCSIVSIASVVLLSCIASTHTFAATTETTSDVPANAINDQSPKHENCDRRLKQLEKLKVNLKLSSIQETAWAEWVGTYKTEHDGWKEHHKDPETWAKLTVPERLEKKLELTKAHVVRLEEHLVAVKKFYDTLTAEQRITFNKDFIFNKPDHKGHWKTEKSIQK